MLKWFKRLFRRGKNTPQKKRAKINKIQFPNEVLLPMVVADLERGKTVTLNLRGFSMRPFLENDRDKGLLTLAVAPKVGDAVLAEISPKKYVLHRIIAIDGDDVTLRGDGNLSEEHCKISDVKGKALGFYRKGSSKLDSTDGKKWKIYSWWWTRLYPIRRYLLAFHRRIWLKIFKPKIQ